MSFLFRPQRRTLAEAMDEVVTLETLGDLGRHLGVPPEQLTVEPYGPGIDKRIGWRTHIVCASGVRNGVVGFTDGPVMAQEAHDV